MSLGLEPEILYLITYSETIYSNLYSAASNLITAGSQATWGTAAPYITQSGVKMQTTASQFHNTINTFIRHLVVLFRTIDQYPFDGGEILMGDIVLAMMQATQDELKMFVGIEDAYHVALWNAPFETEFYADLARKWAVWQ